MNELLAISDKGVESICVAVIICVFVVASAYVFVKSLK